jgi:hypothetical protein
MVANKAVKKLKKGVMGWKSVGAACGIFHIAKLKTVIWWMTFSKLLYIL